MESITNYIEANLKLKVNCTKSKISRPTASAFLGFSFYNSKAGWQIRIAPKSLGRIKNKMRAKTRRNDPTPAKEKIQKMNAVIRGWVNYFAIAKCKSNMQRLDEFVRTRLCIGIWKQWKLPRTKRMQLVKLDIHKQKAYEWGNSRKGYCRVAHSPILCRALSNDFFVSYCKFIDS